MHKKGGTGRFEKTGNNWKKNGGGDPKNGIFRHECFQRVAMAERRDAKRKGKNKRLCCGFKEVSCQKAKSQWVGKTKGLILSKRKGGRQAATGVGRGKGRGIPQRQRKKERDKNDSTKKDITYLKN